MAQDGCDGTRPTHNDHHSGCTAPTLYSIALHCTATLIDCRRRKPAQRETGGETQPSACHIQPRALAQLQRTHRCTHAVQVSWERASYEQWSALADGGSDHFNEARAEPLRCGAELDSLTQSQPTAHTARTQVHSYPRLIFKLMAARRCENTEEHKGTAAQRVRSHAISATAAVHCSLAARASSHIECCSSCLTCVRPSLALRSLPCRLVHRVCLAGCHFRIGRAIGNGSGGR